MWGISSFGRALPWHGRGGEFESRMLHHFIWEKFVKIRIQFIEIFAHKKELYVVPQAGLEPAHPSGHQILSLARLPFRHCGTFFRVLCYLNTKQQLFQ